MPSCAGILEPRQSRLSIYIYIYVYLNWFWRNSLLKCVFAAQNRQKIPILAFKVIEFGSNREPVYDFLLVINSILGPISHRYWDTATYWLKLANFSRPPHLAPSFRALQNFGKASQFLKPFQAADGEDLVILACTVFWLIHPCRHTDWCTNGRTELRWLRRAESSSCFRA